MESAYPGGQRNPQRLFEPGVAFYLEGPGAPCTDDEGRINRAPHFAGGRMIAAIKGRAFANVGKIASGWAGCSESSACFRIEPISAPPGSRFQVMSTRN